MKEHIKLAFLRRKKCFTYGFIYIRSKGIVPTDAVDLGANVLLMIFLWYK